MGSVIELTKHLVRMNTINPPGDEEACARFLGNILETAKVSVSYFPFPISFLNILNDIINKNLSFPLF